MAEPLLLVGDIGGTYARFALADPHTPAFSHPLKLRCADFETADAAIAHFMAQQGLSEPDAMCLAVAGPVAHGAVCMTNNHWQLDGDSLAGHFAARQVRLINDFEAIACALPFLTEQDTRVIGPGVRPQLSRADFNVGVLGPGTGLGVAGLLGRSGLAYPVVGEGGHVGFAPETAQQSAVLTQLRKRFGRVSCERVVSGPGLENIFAALRAIHGKPERSIAAAELFARAADNRDSMAFEAVNLLFEVLGQVAGDLALQLGALDGIFIAGGMVQRYPEFLEESAFRTAFERKGRRHALLAQVPTLLITHEYPGLLGVASCALQMVKSPGKSRSPGSH